MTRNLYRTPIPESGIRDTSESVQAQLARLGLLGGGAAVEPVSSGPSDLQLGVQYRGRYAGRLGLELAELLSSQPLQPLPFAAVGDQTADDGYYAVESVSNARIRPQTDQAVSVDGHLTRKGTRASLCRSLETSPDQRANDFGSDTVTHVAAPASASLVRWWDGSTGVEYPAPVATRTARFGDVAIYDADAAPFASPRLVYRPADLDSQGDVDVKIWDTYGETSPTDQDGVVQWGRVYSPAHQPRVDEELVVENGLLRLWIDPGSETITAERWDTGASSWSDIALGDSAWSPVDLDVRVVAPARLEARVLFSDGSARYPLDLLLTRGDTEALFVRVPDATGATPAGLVDLLSPIAATTIYDPGGTLGVVTREEVPV